MAEQRKESSVLFSLRELRGIEDERVQEEQDAARRAEEDRVRQRLEAERRAQAEEEARRIQKETEERLVREDEERRVREEQLRQEAVERRARVEAQAALERERVARELEQRAIEAHKKRPTALIAMAVGLLIVIGGLGTFLYNQSQESDRKDREAKARAEEIRKGIDETLQNISDLDTERDARRQKLLAAEDAADKAAAQKALEETEAKLREQKDQLKRLRERTQENIRREEAKKVNPNCDKSDPLCGM